MQFIMLGFEQKGGIRRYAFQGVSVGTRTDFTVGVELALIPSYGIRIQELPLLCRELLERRGEDEEKRTLTFTEAEMRVYSDSCATARAAAAQKRKLPRRPSGTAPEPPVVINGPVVISIGGRIPPPNDEEIM